MRRTALLLLPLLAACGGGDDDPGSAGPACRLEDGVDLTTDDLDACSPSDFAPASYACDDGSELLATDDGWIRLDDGRGTWHDGGFEDEHAACTGP